MPGRSILLFALLLPPLIAPGGALAQATPTGTPTPACDFPPVSTERLREIERDLAEHPVPTPTQPDRSYQGFWTSQVHLHPFPPPAGEPLDDAALASLLSFLDDYAQCLVDGPILGVYGAWSEEFLRIELGQRQEQGSLEPMIAILEATPELVFPHPGLELLLLRAWSIESGHLIAVVQLVGTPETWVLYLLPEDGSWRIDDIWDLIDRPMSRDPFDESLTGPVYGTPVAVD